MKEHILWMFRLLKDELAPKEGVGMRDRELSRSASAQTLEIGFVVNALQVRMTTDSMMLQSV